MCGSECHWTICFFFHTFERMVMILTLGVRCLLAHIQLTRQPFLDFGLLTLPKDIASCPFLGLLSQRHPSPAALDLSGSFCSPPPTSGLLCPCLHLLCCVVPASIGHPHRVERASSQSFLCPQSWKGGANLCQVLGKVLLDEWVLVHYTFLNCICHSEP